MLARFFSNASRSSEKMPGLSTTRLYQMQDMPAEMIGQIARQLKGNNQEIIQFYLSAIDNKSIRQVLAPFFLTALNAPPVFDAEEDDHLQFKLLRTFGQNIPSPGSRIARLIADTKANQPDIINNIKATNSVHDDLDVFISYCYFTDDINQIDVNKLDRAIRQLRQEDQPRESILTTLKAIRTYLFLTNRSGSCGQSVNLDHLLDYQVGNDATNTIVLPYDYQYLNLASAQLRHIRFGTIRPDSSLVAETDPAYQIEYDILRIHKVNLEKVDLTNCPIMLDDDYRHRSNVFDKKNIPLMLRNTVINPTLLSSLIIFDIGMLNNSDFHFDLIKEGHISPNSLRQALDSYENMLNNQASYSGSVEDYLKSRSGFFVDYLGSFRTLMVKSVSRLYKQVNENYQDISSLHSVAVNHPLFQPREGTFSFFKTSSTSQQSLEMTYRRLNQPEEGHSKLVGLKGGDQ